MEGSLLVPPDRGTIIGRAVWKPRFVVFGPPPQQQSPQTRPPIPRSNSTARIQAAITGLRSASKSEESARVQHGEIWLSVYKQKGDLEPTSQYSLSSIKSCEIQQVQYRKPGPVIPTLVIQFDLDFAAEKARRRRSSRAGTMSSSFSSPNTLLFRTLPDERYSIYDWQITMQPHIECSTEHDTPVSPQSPQSPKIPYTPVYTNFINPFASKVPGTDRQPVTKTIPKPEQHHRGSSNTSTTYFQGSISRDRVPPSTLISPTPSLRSRRSDLSSQASSKSRPQGFNGALPIQQAPNDLPSPTSTIGYDDQFISGWTSAQGRSSALSSHTRGSNSISMTGTSPPAPRESILDRAFMMRYIPGSDRHPSGDEENGKLSSIARFEALMKEVDERKNSQTSNEGGRKESMRSWELDQDDEDLDMDSKSNRNGNPGEEEFDVDSGEMPSPAQRALEYISGRSTPAPQYHSPMSPKSPPLPLLADRPMLKSSKSDSPSTLKVGLVPVRPKSPADADLNRRSSASVKRLSFTEFTRRISSSSSLLLMQTNASSGSSRASKRSSVEDDGDDSGLNSMPSPRGLSQSRASGAVRGRTPGINGGSGNGPVLIRDDNGDPRCGTWKGSGFGGVFGGEGGFV